MYRDEATIHALSGLAQGDHDGPLGASLDVLTVPIAARVATERLESFTVALAQAGWRRAPSAGEAGALINWRPAFAGLRCSFGRGCPGERWLHPFGSH
jgi:hypothetical protein